MSFFSYDTSFFLHKFPKHILTPHHDVQPGHHHQAKSRQAVIEIIPGAVILVKAAAAGPIPVDIKPIDTLGIIDDQVASAPEVA